MKSLSEAILRMLLMKQQDENEDGEFTTYEGKLIGEQFTYQIGDNEGELIEEKMTA